MKLFPHIKVNLLGFIKNSKITIITFLIFPMVMAYIYGTMQKDSFSGKSTFTAIPVEFKYDKTTKEGEILNSILKEKTVKNFINADSKESLKCRVKISNDFKSISIEKLKGSDTEISIVKSFMKTFSESINQYSIVVDNVNNLSLKPEEKSQLLNKLLYSMGENNKASAITEKVIPGYRTLGSREYYTISMFSYTSIMLVMILAVTFYKSKKTGVIRRSFSTPSSKEAFLMGYFISSFIIAVGVNLIYITINKVLGIAFTENFSLNILLVLMQSLLQASVIIAIISFISSEQVANAVMTVLMIIPVIVGGVFFNADIIEIKILKVLANFSPNSLILDSYKNLSITGSLTQPGNTTVITLILSLILIVASLLKVSYSWEE